MVGSQILQWHLAYLGIPLRGNPKALSFRDPVIQNVSKHMDNWKGA